MRGSSYGKFELRKVYKVIWASSYRNSKLKKNKFIYNHTTTYSPPPTVKLVLDPLMKKLFSPDQL